jgi:hypothetical protein
MKLTTREKRAIAPIIEQLADFKVLNRGAIGLPLNYIPEASHTIEDIIRASEDLSNDLISNETLEASPLYSALHKIKHIVKIAHIDKLHSLQGLYPITINLASWSSSNIETKSYNIYLASPLYGMLFRPTKGF